MKTDEVPQDSSAYAAVGKKALYAVDASGHYGTVASQGWVVEEAVTSDAVGEYARLALAARVEVEAGRKSPLWFHMWDKRMDEPTLAGAAKVWGWRLRRHFSPAVFATLKPELLARYADALGLSTQQLQRLP